MIAARIAALNDAARSSFIGCRVVITMGISTINDLDGLYAKVQAFTAFTDSNDPYGEHDFGAVEHEGQTVFWKFDLYEETFVKHVCHARQFVRGHGNCCHAGQCSNHPKLAVAKANAEA